MNLKEFGENVRRMRKLREMTGEKMAENVILHRLFSGR